MDRQKLMQRINLEMIMDNIASIGTVEAEYDRSQDRILEDIHRHLQDQTVDDQTVMNDIKDCIAISEEKAFIIGFYEGMKLMR